MAIKRESITLVLIRCGATSWDESGRVHGATDLPLSDLGRQSVKADLPLLDGSRCATVYQAADEAASETAALAARHLNARTRVVNELAGPNLGLLEGISLQDFADRYPSRYRQWQEDPLSLSPPEGESLVDAADRVFKAIAKIVRRARADEVGIVLHPLNIGLVRCWMSDTPLGEFRSMLQGRAGVERYALSMELIDELASAAEALHHAST